MDTRLDVVAKAVARGGRGGRRCGWRGAAWPAAELGRRSGAHEEARSPAVGCVRSGGPIIAGIGTDEFGIELPCAGNEDCPHGRECQELLTPGNQLVCRCIPLD